MLTLCLTSLLLAGTSVFSASELPSPKVGGAEGAPINLLVISSTANKVPLIDPVYEKELKGAGYNLAVMGQDGRLSHDYLQQFGVVVLANLPCDGEEYTVFGYLNQHLKENLALLHDYVDQGGGLLVVPAVSELGEAYGKTYDTFLKPWGGSLLIQQLKDRQSSRKNEMGAGAYGVGSINSSHPISATLQGEKVLYPQNVMRWDHAYSCTPLLTDSNWTILASADNAQTHVAVSNGEVAEPLTDNTTLYAVREAGKGRVALSAIHSYYRRS